MSIRGKIRKTIDPHAKLVTIHRTNSYTSNDRSLSVFEIIANVLRGHNLRVNKEEEQERNSCWCYIVIDGARFEAKIIHKGRGKFKILNDEYGGKYSDKIVDASDVIRCRIDI
jgi:hypothetical protein